MISNAGGKMFSLPAVAAAAASAKKHESQAQQPQQQGGGGFFSFFKRPEKKAEPVTKPLKNLQMIFYQRLNSSLIMVTKMSQPKKSSSKQINLSRKKPLRRMT
eukprot:00933.XXX_2343_2664_1 [CDS] Oithona nana genome sequencing.